MRNPHTTAIEQPLLAAAEEEAGTARKTQPSQKQINEAIHKRDKPRKRKIRETEPSTGEKSEKPCNE